jgi:hypothetical protein
MKRYEAVGVRANWTADQMGKLCHDRLGVDLKVLGKLSQTDCTQAHYVIVGSKVATGVGVLIALTGLLMLALRL